MSLVPVKSEEIDPPGTTEKGPYTQLELSTIITDEGRVVLRVDETVAVSSTTSQKCDEYLVPKTEPQSDASETVLPAPRSTSPDTTECFTLDLKQENVDASSPASELSNAATAAPVLSDQQKTQKCDHKRGPETCLEAADKSKTSSSVASDNGQGSSSTNIASKDVQKDSITTEEIMDTKESAPHFRCEECNKTFEDSAILQLHRKKHSRQKPFHCTQCRKSFTSYFILMQHLLVHSKSLEKAKAQEDQSDRDCGDPNKHSETEKQAAELSSPEKDPYQSPHSETEKQSAELSSPEKDPYQSPHSSSQVVSKTDPDVVCEKSTSPGLVSSSSESQKTIALKRESETKDACTSSSADYSDNSCEPSTSDSADCILVSYRRRSSTESPSKTSQSVKLTLDSSRLSNLTEKTKNQVLSSNTFQDDSQAVDTVITCKTESQTTTKFESACEQTLDSITTKDNVTEQTLAGEKCETKIIQRESVSAKFESKSDNPNQVLTIDLCSVTDDSSQASSICDDQDKESLLMSGKDETSTKSDSNLRSPGWYPCVSTCSADVNESQVWEKMVEEDNSQSSVADKEDTASLKESHDPSLPSNSPTMHNISPKESDTASADSAENTTNTAKEHPTIRSLLEALSGTKGLKTNDGASNVNQSVNQDNSSANVAKIDSEINECDSGGQNDKTDNDVLKDSCENSAVTEDLHVGQVMPQVESKSNSEEIDYEIWIQTFGGGTSSAKKTSSRKTEATAVAAKGAKPTCDQDTSSTSSESIKVTEASQSVTKVDKPKRPVGRPRKYPVGAKPRGRPPIKRRNMPTRSGSCPSKNSGAGSNISAKSVKRFDVVPDTLKSDVSSKSAPRAGENELTEILVEVEKPANERKSGNDKGNQRLCESVQKCVESDKLSNAANGSTGESIQSCVGDSNSSMEQKDESKSVNTSLSVNEAVHEKDKVCANSGMTPGSASQSQESNYGPENGPEEKKFYGTGAVISQRMLERIAELKGKIKKVKKHKKNKKKDLISSDAASSTDTDINDKTNERVDDGVTMVTSVSVNKPVDSSTSENTPKKTKKKKHKKDKTNAEVSKKKKRKLKKCKQCVLSGEKCPHVKKKKRKKKDKKLKEPSSNSSLVSSTFDTTSASFDTCNSHVESDFVSEVPARTDNELSKVATEVQSSEMPNCEDNNQSNLCNETQVAESNSGKINENESDVQPNEQEVQHTESVVKSHSPTAKVGSVTRTPPRPSHSMATTPKTPSPTSKLRASPRRSGRAVSEEAPIAAKRVLRNRVSLAKPTNYNTEPNVSSPSKTHWKLPPPGCKLTRLPNGRLLREITGPLPVRSQLYFLKQVRNSTDSDTKNDQDNVQGDVQGVVQSDSAKDGKDPEVSKVANDAIQEQIDEDNGQTTEVNVIESAEIPQVEAAEVEEHASEDVQSEVTDAATEIYTDDGGDTELEDNELVNDEEEASLLPDCASSVVDQDAESVSTIPNEEETKSSETVDEGTSGLCDDDSVSFSSCKTQELPCKSEMADSTAYRKTPKSTKTKQKSKKKFEWNDIQEAISVGKKKRKKRPQCDCVEVSELAGVLGDIDLGPVVPKTGPVVYNLASVLEGCPLFSSNHTPPLCSSSPALLEVKSDAVQPDDSGVTENVHAVQNAVTDTTVSHGTTSDVNATPVITELPNISNEAALQTISGTQQMPLIVNFSNLPIQSSMYQQPLHYLFPAGSQYALPLSVPISSSTNNQISFIPNLQNFQQNYQMHLQNFQQPLLQNYTIPQNVPLMQNWQLPQTLPTLQNLLSPQGTLQQPSLPQPTLQQPAAQPTISLVQNIGDACQLTSLNQVIMPQNSMPQSVQTIQTIPPVQSVQQTLQPIQNIQAASQATDVPVQQRLKNQRFILPAPKKSPAGDKNFSQILMNPSEIKGPTFASVAQEAKLSKMQPGNSSKPVKTDATPEKSRPKAKSDKKLNDTPLENVCVKPSQQSEPEQAVKGSAIKSTTEETPAIMETPDESVSTPSKPVKEPDSIDKSATKDTEDGSSPEQEVSPPLTRSKKLQDSWSLRSVKKHKGVRKLIGSVDPKSHRLKSKGSDDKGSLLTRARRLGMTRSRSSTPEPKKPKSRDHTTPTENGEDSQDDSITSEADQAQEETAVETVVDQQEMTKSRDMTPKPDATDATDPVPTDENVMQQDATNAAVTEKVEESSRLPEISADDDNDVYNFTDTEDNYEAISTSPSVNQEHEKDSVVSESESSQSQDSSAFPCHENDSRSAEMPDIAQTQEKGNDEVPVDINSQTSEEKDDNSQTSEEKDDNSQTSEEKNDKSYKETALDADVGLAGGMTERKETQDTNTRPKQQRISPLKRNKQVKLPRIPQDQLIGLNRRIYRPPILSSIQKYERVKLIINESLENVKNSINVDDGCSFEEKLVKELNNGLNSCKELHDGIPKSRGFPKLAISKDLSSLKILIFWESGKEPCTVTITQNQVPTPKSASETIQRSKEGMGALATSALVDESLASSQSSNLSSPESAASVSPKSAEMDQGTAATPHKMTPMKATTGSLPKRLHGAKSPIHRKSGFGVKKSGKSGSAMKFRVASKGALISVRTVREKGGGNPSLQENSQSGSHSANSSQQLSAHASSDSQAIEDDSVPDCSAVNLPDSESKTGDANSKESQPQQENPGRLSLLKEDESTFKWSKSSFQGKTYNNRKRKRDEVGETELVEKPSINDPEKVFKQDDAFEKAKSVGCPSKGITGSPSKSMQETTQEAKHELSAVKSSSESESESVVGDTAPSSGDTVDCTISDADRQTGELVSKELDPANGESNGAESKSHAADDDQKKTEEQAKYYLSASELLGLHKPAEPNAGGGAVVEAAAEQDQQTGNSEDEDPKSSADEQGQDKTNKISPVRTRANTRSASRDPPQSACKTQISKTQMKVLKRSTNRRDCRKDSGVSIGVSTRRRSALSPGPVVSAVIKSRKILTSKRGLKETSTSKTDSPVVKDDENAVTNKLMDMINTVCNEAKSEEPKFEAVKKNESISVHGAAYAAAATDNSTSDEYPSADLPCPSPATLDSSLLVDLENLEAQKPALLDDSFGANDNDNDSVKEAVDCILEMLDDDNTAPSKSDEENEIHLVSQKSTEPCLSTADTAEISCIPRTCTTNLSTAEASSPASDIDSVKVTMDFMLDMIETGKVSDITSTKQESENRKICNISPKPSSKEQLLKFKPMRSRSVDSGQKETGSRDHKIRDCYVTLENIDIEKEVAFLKSDTEKSLSKLRNLKRRGSTDCLPVFDMNKIKDCFVKLKKMKVKHVDAEDDMKTAQSKSVTEESNEMPNLEEPSTEMQGGISGTSDKVSHTDGPSDQNQSNVEDPVLSNDLEASVDEEDTGGCAVRLVLQSTVEANKVSSEIQVSESWDDGDIVVICCEEKMESEDTEYLPLSEEAEVQDSLPKATDTTTQEKFCGLTDELPEPSDSHVEKEVKATSTLESSELTPVAEYKSKPSDVPLGANSKSGIIASENLPTSDLTVVITDVIKLMVDKVAENVNAKLEMTDKFNLSMCDKLPQNPNKNVPKRRSSSDDFPLLRKKLCTDICESASSVNVSQESDISKCCGPLRTRRSSADSVLSKSKDTDVAKYTNDSVNKSVLQNSFPTLSVLLLKQKN